MSVDSRRDAWDGVVAHQRRSSELKIPIERAFAGTEHKHSVYVSWHASKAASINVRYSVFACLSEEHIVQLSHYLTGLTQNSRVNQEGTARKL